MANISTPKPRQASLSIFGWDMRSGFDERTLIEPLLFLPSVKGSKHAVFEMAKYLPEMISIENSRGKKKHN